MPAIRAACGECSIIPESVTRMLWSVAAAAAARGSGEEVERERERRRRGAK